MVNEIHKQTYKTYPKIYDLWKENETKVKVSLQENLGLETEEIVRKKAEKEGPL